MPLTLDAFQAAIRGKNDNGFVEFSSKDNRVNTYATGFFARTFGWYRTRSAETNREVRQQFFNMLSDSGRCQAGVLSEIKNRLGLASDGNGVQDRPLSIREVRTMMDWAERSAHVEKFSIKASPEYAKGVLDKFKEGISTRLALPDDTTDDKLKLWEQTAKDANRVGLELTINGKQICKALDSQDYSKEALKETTEEADKAFNAQTPNDKKAAKIISGIVHQRVGGCFTIPKGTLGNTMPGVSCGIPASIQSSRYPCSVQRQEDGSYDIDVAITLDYLKEMSLLGENEFFTGNTQITFSAKLKLSFDERNAPNLEFRDDGPVLKGSREKCGYNEEEISLLTNIMATEFLDAQGALPPMMDAPGLMHNPELRTKVDELMTMRSASKEHPEDKGLSDRIEQKRTELRNFIKGFVVTADDQRRLAAMGIDTPLFSLLSTDWGGSPKIDRRLMNQLNSPNEMEVAKGLTTLQRMCKKAHALGYMSKEVVLNPTNTALIDVGGFSLKGNLFKETDVGMLVAYCKRNPQEHLVKDLISFDQEKVAGAKNRLKDILQGERRNVGLALLESQYKFKSDGISRLQERIDEKTLSGMMEHIYRQDAEMENTLETLRQAAMVRQ